MEPVTKPSTHAATHCRRAAFFIQRNFALCEITTQRRQVRQKDTAMSKFIIRDNDTGHEVISFSNRHQIVQWTSCPSQVAPKFFTEKTLPQFLAAYDNCGYGFSMDDCTIYEIKGFASRCRIAFEETASLMKAAKKLRMRNV